jgi:AcrR family transcriptional regulator
MGGSSENAPNRSSRSQGTRAALVGAGLRTFAERGYAGSRLADIANEAGLTTGAFYRHFSSKQEFFAALFEDYGNALQERLNACDNLTAQFEEMIRVSRRYRGVIRAAAEVGVPGSDTAEMQRSLRDASATLLARHLQDLPSWRITHGSAAMLADTLGQLIFMEVAAWTPERDPTAIATALDRLVQQGLYTR